ncbi:hypothetical protein [Thalassotalea marina]|uniref:Uncharacterized protein n=1 Tax=Thalassotalea marina TaxID=1673741 RepID=A0A919EIY3_9GAMM|nr:hypothetical protein [Thalassotalea marina]GHF85792.1 hypothetical protein GCM10017161_11760 [Thalassotalea marina]
MTEQVSLWQNEVQSGEFAELCCALYEREIAHFVLLDISNTSSLQNRLKSLPYYVKRTASRMLEVESPLDIDLQNASWSAKQASHMPLTGQDIDQVNQWYNSFNLTHGLVVPIAQESHIVLDSIDRIDTENSRFRTNVFGWFDMQSQDNDKPVKLLKPNKKVMTAACTGHTWINDHKANPTIPTLRELLLSCAINWRNFKQPLPIKQ